MGPVVSAGLLRLTIFYSFMNVSHIIAYRIRVDCAVEVGCDRIGLNPPTRNRDKEEEEQPKGDLLYRISR